MVLNEAFGKEYGESQYSGNGNWQDSPWLLAAAWCVILGRLVDVCVLIADPLAM